MIIRLNSHCIRLFSRFRWFFSYRVTNFPCLSECSNCMWPSLFLMRFCACMFAICSNWRRQVLSLLWFRSSAKLKGRSNDCNSLNCLRNCLIFSSVNLLKFALVRHRSKYHCHFLLVVWSFLRDWSSTILLMLQNMCQIVILSAIQRFFLVGRADPLLNLILLLVLFKVLRNWLLFGFYFSLICLIRSGNDFLWFVWNHILYHNIKKGWLLILLLKTCFSFGTWFLS